MQSLRWAGQGTCKVIIMTSAYTAPKYRTEALTAYRADEYITKPVDFKLLEALIKKLI